MSGIGGYESAHNCRRWRSYNSKLKTSSPRSADALTSGHAEREHLMRTRRNLTIGRPSIALGLFCVCALNMGSPAQAQRTCQPEARWDDFDLAIAEANRAAAAGKRDAARLQACQRIHPNIAGTVAVECRSDDVAARRSERAWRRAVLHGRNILMKHQRLPICGSFAPLPAPVKKSTATEP